MGSGVGRRARMKHVVGLWKSFGVPMVGEVWKGKRRGLRAGLGCSEGRDQVWA